MINCYYRNHVQFVDIFKISKHRQCIVLVFRDAAWRHCIVVISSSSTLLSHVNHVTVQKQRDCQTTDLHITSDNVNSLTNSLVQRLSANTLDIRLCGPVTPTLTILSPSGCSLRSWCQDGHVWLCVHTIGVGEAPPRVDAYGSYRA